MTPTNHPRLWMDEILHHFEKPLLVGTTIQGLPTVWFPERGIPRFIPSSPAYRISATSHGPPLLLRVFPRVSAEEGPGQGPAHRAREAPQKDRPMQQNLKRPAKRKTETRGNSLCHDCAGSLKRHTLNRTGPGRDMCFKKALWVSQLVSWANRQEKKQTLTSSDLSLSDLCYYFIADWIRIGTFT